ncbi:IS1 family transposase [Peribacillus simplex]|uniref:IS1595 family transposase n=1 Tax=Peribacillus simplex TaxID=1478 RepID=UPI0035C6AD37|nr:IS1 family transposase [Peribacillus simplex]
MKSKSRHEQVCVLVARGRTKNTFVGLLGCGRITKKQLDKVIGDKLNPSTVLCTDAWRAFKTYASDKGFTHYRFKTGAERAKGIYHIQNVNNYHQRLKQWIMRFKGVATKYLQHYLGWFNFMDTLALDTDERSIRTFAVESYLHPINETNATIPLRKMIA